MCSPWKYPPHTLPWCDLTLPRQLNSEAEEISVAVLCRTAPGCAVIYKVAGETRIFTAGACPPSLQTQLADFATQPGLAPIKCIAFGKSEHWILLQGQSGYSFWGSETALHEALEQNRKDQNESTLVAMTPAGGWVLVTNGCGYNFSATDMPQIVKDGLQKAYEAKKDIKAICTS